MEIWQEEKCISIMPKSALYFEPVWKKYEEVQTLDDIDSIELSDITEEELNYLVKQAKYLYYNSDKALLYSFGGSILESSLNSFGHVRFFIKMVERPDFVHYWFNKLTNNHMSRLEKILNRIG